MKHSFGTAFQRSVPKEKTWIYDRHLRNGFLLGLPIFFGAVFTFMSKSIQPNAGIIILFVGAILSNLVWLGYAAWSRDRSQSGEPGTGEE